MTRRDRAALSLAYEVLRDPYGNGEECWAIERCIDVLALGDTVGRTLADDLAEAKPVDAWRERDTMRFLRARLALALRVLLRVDAGDFGRPVLWLRCRICGRYDKSGEPSQMVCVPYPRPNREPVCEGLLDVVRGIGWHRYRALWEQPR